MLTDLRLRLRSLFRRSRVDGELDEELQFHFEQEVATYEASGLSHDEAIRRARLQFGSFALAKEEHRDARGVSVVEGVAADLRYAVRQIRRSPGFALLTFTLLGLGIGVNTAVFSTISAVLLRPLAVDRPDRLVTVTRNNRAPWSYSVFQDFRTGVHSVDGLSASLPMESDIDVDGSSEFVTAEAVTSNYGEVLRPTLRLGRWFSNDRESSAVISEALWERRFNRNAHVLGHLLRSQSETYTVIGIVSSAFTGVFAPMRTDLWVPIRSRPSLEPLLNSQRPVGLLMLFGRLRSDATIPQLGAELRAIDQRLPVLIGNSSDRQPLIVESVRGVPNAASRHRLRTMTTLLAAVAGVVLLITCVNVGSLLLGRGTARRREFAMRRALGASGTRVLRQLLAEAVVLATGGCVFGALIAVAMTRVLSSSLPALIPGPGFGTELHLRLDWRVLAFTILVSVAAAIASNVVPARVATRVRGLLALRGDAVIAPGRRPLGTVMQVAFSLVLLLVAGSFVQRLLQLQATPLGFSVNDRVYADVFVPSDSITAESRQALYRRAIAGLEALPGVRSAAVTSAMPLMPTESECVADPALRERVGMTAAGPRYFDTLGIALVAGRDFDSTNISSSQGVIVNETLARRLWPGTSPLGRRISVGCDARRTEIVRGVVRDSVVGTVGEPPRPHVYRPFTVADTERLVPIVISARSDADGMVDSIRHSLIDLGSGVRIYAVAPLDLYVEQSYGQFRWMTRLLTGFGLIALALAIVGLYGVTAYRVALRTREIGVRMALGANRADVFREVVARGLGVVLTGVAIGEVLALTSLRFLGSLQEGVRQPSTLTHVVAALLWIATASLACCRPAARAAGVDPLIALRHE